MVAVTKAAVCFSISSVIFTKRWVTSTVVKVFSIDEHNAGFAHCETLAFPFLLVSKKGGCDERHQLSLELW